MPVLMWEACGWVGVLVLSATVVAASEKAGKFDAGPFVRALWAVQRYGTPDAADPRHDERTKAMLAASLAKDGTLTSRAVENKLMDEKTFQALAGDDQRLHSSALQRALDSDVPDTRRRLFPTLAAHLGALTTSFDRIDAAHLAAGEKPQIGFAAVMVCSQADAECPFVKGAAQRISLPFLDPKIYDDGAYETDKYAERRDGLGRLMLAVMLKARRQLEAAGKVAPAAIVAERH